ncbi:loganic acid O-methyltransferase-like [Rosa rugosa]|uniref:loganic acid O-methyltransferase-like n=1 Tax=Rosa rugosa TaxID=74645 RepID=UPI002B40E69D|nr:loganic acid O-methyltransferase-like [Rosa rugosa]
MAADEACPMKGGDGPNSYAKNSIYQKGAVDAAKELLSKAIAEKLDLEILLASNSTFQIADLGCSIGPNTFWAIENILEAVELKYQIQGMKKSPITLEFQVFFNDHTPNDFNMLFKSLPLNRQYYAAGVPGSFYGRLFPKASLHFVHSSTAIHWLSRVPKDLADRNSRSWNKGKIQFSHSSDEVIRAFEAQFSEDMECFLNARAQEIVYGGLVALIVSGRPDGTPHSDSSLNVIYHLLGSCLMEMARKGVVSEEKVDAFNITMFYMSPQELKAAVELNGRFTIECMENLPRLSTIDNVTESPQLIASHVRAVTEVLFQQQFGDEILDELFDLYRTKLEEKPSIFDPTKAINFLVVLKRQAN